MKRFFSTLLVLICLIAGGVHAAQDVVYIDLQEVFKRFYKTQLAQDQIKQQADDIKLEREDMEADIKLIKDEIELLRADSRDTTLSEEIREGKRSQLEEKLVKLQKDEKEMIDFEKLRMQQLEQQNTRMSRKLFDEIQEAINDYAKEKDYISVIDRSSQSRAGMQMVLYVNSKADITADVLVVLNEGHEELLIQDPTIDVEQ
jgi:Skp family chaperone for outer membrane proteins